MKMLCDYCDKRNECTKIISNEYCSEFAHKLSFTEIDDSRDFYSLSNRMEWDYVNLDIHIIYSLCHYIVDESNAVEIKAHNDFGDRYIFSESETEEMDCFFNKDEAETVANILNSCRG